MTVGAVDIANSRPPPSAETVEYALTVGQRKIVQLWSNKVLTDVRVTS